MQIEYTQLKMAESLESFYHDMRIVEFLQDVTSSNSRFV